MLNLVINMTGNELYTWLAEKMPHTPEAAALIQHMRDRYGAGATVSDLLYWLYESEYSTLGWRKRHLEMDDVREANDELAAARIGDKAIELLETLNKQ